VTLTPIREQDPPAWPVTKQARAAWNSQLPKQKDPPHNSKSVAKG